MPWQSSSEIPERPGASAWSTSKTPNKIGPLACRESYPNPRVRNRRGELTTDVDPHLNLEALLAPLHFRTRELDVRIGGIERDVPRR